MTSPHHTQPKEAIATHRNRQPWIRPHGGHWPHYTAQCCAYLEARLPDPGTPNLTEFPHRETQGDMA
jgi:hypothetical protein